MHQLVCACSAAPARGSSDEGCAHRRWRRRRLLDCHVRVRRFGVPTFNGRDVLSSWRDVAGAAWLGWWMSKAFSAAACDDACLVAKSGKDSGASCAG
jgi:hypothetical protein